MWEGIGNSKVEATQPKPFLVFLVFFGGRYVHNQEGMVMAMAFFHFSWLLWALTGLLCSILGEVAE